MTLNLLDHIEVPSAFAGFSDFFVAGVVEASVREIRLDLLLLCGKYVPCLSDGCMLRLGLCLWQAILEGFQLNREVEVFLKHLSTVAC